MISFTPIHILFSIGNIHIYTWGLVFIISFLISFFLAKKYTKNILEEKHFLNIMLLILIGIIVGIRLLYVFINFSYYIADPIKILAFNEGGSSSFGGFLAVLFVWLYIKKHKLNFAKILDAFAPWIVLALALGRIGCFLAWDDFGIASSLPWAVNADGVARHPTQIYLLIANLIVFWIILKLQKKKEKLPTENKSILRADGSIFLFMILYYAINRFFIDFLRVYQQKEFFLHLAVSQWFSLVFIIIASLILISMKKKSKNKLTTQINSPQPINLQCP